MPHPNYIVLRTERLFVPDAGNLGAPRFGILGEIFGGVMGAGSSSNAETLEVSTMALSKAERDDLRRDPRTQGIAEAMPILRRIKGREDRPSTKSY